VKRIRVLAFGGPEVLAMEDAELPKPGPQEVLIRVKAAGVNPYETYARAGTYGRAIRRSLHTRLRCGGYGGSLGEGFTILRSAIVSLPWAPQRVVCTVRAVRTKPRAIVAELDQLRAGSGAVRALCNRIPGIVSTRANCAGRDPSGARASGGVGIAALQFARAAD